jgi:hypothetical protein
MERDNMELYQEVQENVAAQNRADTKTAEIFAFFDEVWMASCAAVVAVLPTVGSDQYGIFGSQIYAKWKELPLEDMQAWTLLTAETQSAIIPLP